jgi:hypothetical protein
MKSRPSKKTEICEALRTVLLSWRFFIFEAEENWTEGRSDRNALNVCSFLKRV